MTIKNINVTILGPSRSGKTTLIAALIAEITKFLKQLNIDINALDDHKTAVELLLNQLNSTINQDELRFKVEKVQGTANVRNYSLAISNEKLNVVPSSININFLDFPGGDLGRNHPNWLQTKEFMLKSHIILLPIDSMLVMEGNNPKYESSVKTLLGLNALLDVIDELVKSQANKISFVFVPLKCENYFVDNGGFLDKSSTLYEKSLAIYQEIHQKIHQVPHSKVYYAPVDTLGSVDLVDVQWENTGHSEFEYAPITHYRIRRDKEVHRQGINNLIKIIFKDNLTIIKNDISKELDDLDGFFSEIFNYSKIECLKELSLLTSNVLKEIATIKSDQRAKEITHV